MKKTIIAFLAVLLASCEKPPVEDLMAGVIDKSGNVVLKIDADNNITRATALSDVCGRLNVAVFDQSGKKVKTVAQVVSDVDFGVVGLSLSPGSYQVVAIGHSCTGSATITSPEKVTFPSNKVTDTFYYCGELTVTAEKQEVGINLQRSVAMLRLKLTGVANDVASLKFYYLGGSSTFSPDAGLGVVNSKQTEVRVFSNDGIYEIYTFPHSTQDVLTKVTVTALDAGDNEVGECLIENVPVTVNRITLYEGDFVSGGGSPLSVNINVNAEWEGIDRISY
jgi:hypothetical protein